MRLFVRFSAALTGRWPRAVLPSADQRRRSRRRRRLLPARIVDSYPRLVRPFLCPSLLLFFHALKLCHGCFQFFFGSRLAAGGPAGALRRHSRPVHSEATSLPPSFPYLLLSPKVNDFRSLFPIRIERKDAQTDGLRRAMVGTRRRRRRRRRRNPLGLTAPPLQSVCEQTALRMCPQGRKGGREIGGGRMKWNGMEADDEGRARLDGRERRKEGGLRDFQGCECSGNCDFDAEVGQSAKGKPNPLCIRRPSSTLTRLRRVYVYDKCLVFLDGLSSGG